MVLAHLRDVHEAVDLILQLDERTKAGQLRDLARDQITDFVFLIDVLPGIVAQLFDAETDSLVGLVDVDHFRFDFLVFLKHFARMIDLTGPAQVGDVNHSINAVFES